MRQSFFLFIVLIVSMLIYSCKSHKVDLKSSMVGHWELRKTTNTQNSMSKIFPPGKGINLFFTDTSYEEFSEGSMISMGKYKFIQDTDKLSGDLSSRVVFKPEIFSWDTTKFVIGFEGNQLIIRVDSVGALIRFYERLD